MLNITLILPNLRSAHNVGAIFRTAEAAGVQQIYLAGYTPAPLDRFGRPDPTIAKTALGAEKLVAWESVKDAGKLISKLKESNFKIIALEQTANSVDYRTIKLSPTAKVAVVMGNEVGGVAPEILEKCDLVAEIPLYGQKESLNVATAAGIFLFSLLSTVEH
jgi:tRNA G18 (ribose-2'-O)-methylase SpoU